MTLYKCGALLKYKKIHKRDNQRQQKNSHKNNHKKPKIIMRQLNNIPIPNGFIFIKHNPQNLQSMLKTYLSFYSLVVVCFF